jgi:hypothetical protein
MLMFDIIMWIIFGPMLFILWLVCVIMLIGLLNKALEFATGGIDFLGKIIRAWERARYEKRDV